MKKGFLFILILALSLPLVACDSNGSLEDVSLDEVLEKGLNKNFDLDSDIKSLESNLSLNLNMDIKEMDPFTRMFLDSFSDIKLTMDTKYDINDAEDIKLELNLKLNSSNLNTDANIYFFDNTLAINLPILSELFGIPELSDSYIVITSDEMEQLMNDFGMGDLNTDFQNDFEEELSEILDIYKNFLRIYLDFLEDFISFDSSTIKIGNENVETYHIDINMDGDNLVELIESIPELLNDEDFQEALIEMVSTYMEVMNFNDFGLALSESEIRDEIQNELSNVSKEEMEEDIKLLVEELENLMNLEAFSLESNMHFDEDFLMRRFDLSQNISIDSYDEFLDSNIIFDINYNMSAENWNINQDIDFNFPELNEENSLYIEDLMSIFFMMMMGM